MSVNITLTSSMRSNLSSLKSLASQMSTTQTRLSTGKKVNSAIDNANSYYQTLICSLIAWGKVSRLLPRR